MSIAGSREKTDNARIKKESDNKSVFYWLFFISKLTYIIGLFGYEGKNIK